MALQLLQYVLIVLAMGASLFLFFTLKREIYDSDKRHKRKCDALDQHLTACKIRLAELSAELAATQQYAQLGPVPQNLSLNKRAQAIRLIRQGESSGHIAAALSLPRKEAELFVKIQKLIGSGEAEITS